jgi:DNA polymerase (family 10)
MDRKNAARSLRRIGRLLEVAGVNPYRVRAFSGAARAVETAGGDLEAMIASGEILELKGVGKGTAAVLEDLVAGRRPQVLEEAEEAVPAGVREMLELPGLGPKKVRTLWRDLGAETLGELEYACRENRLLDLKGFGPASQAAVLDALLFRRTAAKRRLIHEAWAASEVVQDRIAGLAGVASIAVAGELRRRAETIRELGFVVTLDDPDGAEAIAGAVGAAERVADGQWLVRLDGELPIRLWFAQPSRFGAVMIRATGDDELLHALELRAASSGARTDGLDDGDEVEVFRSLDLDWIPPELRDGSGWLDRAVGGALPTLVELGDLGGALHNHTTDSDGLATIEEMAAAAADRGWEFFGVADHSPAAFYANGVDAVRLRAQWVKADEWNASDRRVRIVKGLEADILSDGRLDIPDGCEDGLDYVVASVHSSFRLTEATQTERITTAVGHPACRVLGHPTGRLLLARPGYEVDLDRVLDACAEHGVAVEINASPYRLDLDRHWARKALDRGLKLVINPDAHSVEGLDDLRWGVDVARRAGATRADLVNCGDIEEWLKR